MGGGGIYNLGFIDNFLSNIVAGNIDTNENSIAVPDLFSVAAGMPSPGITPTIPPSSVEGFNLIGNCGAEDACQLYGAVNINYDIIGTYIAPIDARLEKLDWNGGPTQTMALKPGSPAINNGSNAWGLMNFDQRNYPFYRVFCGMADIGAYEAEYCYAENTL